MKLIRKRVLADRLGVSRATLDRWAHDPRYGHLNFPQPVPLGDASVAWIEAEVQEWLEARKAARDSEAA